MMTKGCRFILAMIWLVEASALHSKAVDFHNAAADATLIELYTSEGCSSCPPAEEWLSGLKNSPKLWKTLFPISFHVDYWDGLGWPDRFARPAYTDRQRTYAALLHQASVYTPEFVVDGREWHEWFQNHELDPSQSVSSGDLQVSVQNELVTAQFMPKEATKVVYHINVALLGSGIVSQVQRGENQGRALQHDFVVLGYLEKPLQPNGNGFTSGKLKLPSTNQDTPGALVAWVSTSSGKVVQVAGGWMSNGRR